MLNRLPIGVYETVLQPIGLTVFKSFAEFQERGNKQMNGVSNRFIKDNHIVNLSVRGLKLENSIGCWNSTDIKGSKNVSYSTGVLDSENVFSSRGVKYSEDVSNSTNVKYSSGVTDSDNIYGCTNMVGCTDFSHCKNGINDVLGTDVKKPTKVKEFGEVKKDDDLTYTHRVKVVDKLINILDNYKSPQLRSIFKKTNVVGYTPINNAWLLGDKFTRFTSTSDNRTTGIITDKVRLLTGGHKPEIAIYYSNNSGELKDVLLVDFKNVNCGDEIRTRATRQTMAYGKIIREVVPNVNNVYIYTFINVDGDLGRELKLLHSFTVAGWDTYRRYDEKDKTTLTITSFKQMVKDANFRYRNND